MRVENYSSNMLWLEGQLDQIFYQSKYMTDEEKYFIIGEMNCHLESLYISLKSLKMLSTRVRKMLKRCYNLDCKFLMPTLNQFENRWGIKIA